MNESVKQKEATAADKYGSKPLKKKRNQQQTLYKAQWKIMQTNLKLLIFCASNASVHNNIQLNCTCGDELSSNHYIMTWKTSSFLVRYVDVMQSACFTLRAVNPRIREEATDRYKWLFFSLTCLNVTVIISWCLSRSQITANSLELNQLSNRH